MAGQAGAAAGDLLRSAALAIHAERDHDRLVGWVANALAAATDAPVAGLVVDMRLQSRTWVVAADSARDLAVLGDPQATPPLQSVLEGTRVRLTDDEQLRRMLGVQSVVVLAVPGAGGRPHGLAVLGWLGDEHAAEGSLAVAEALLAHLGVALDNRVALAGVEAAQRDVIHKLQEAVHPPTPSVPQTELGVFYLAADQQASMGGDLYDWVLLPDGTLHLAVVDVMGKGVSATKDALAVTHALRLLVLDGVSLDVVIARADALVTAQNPELVATLIIGRYDPTSGKLQLAGGGHPPPLAILGGAAQWIAVGGRPIGFPGAGSDGIVTIELDRSDTVIFYTDGLIEATKDIISGLDKLAHSAEDTARYPAAALARALVERSLADAVRNDDSLALVLRRRSPPPPSNGLPLAPFEYRFTPSAAAVPLARHFLHDWLVRVPVEAGEASDLLLVATELVANAVRHSSGQPAGVALRASVHEGDVILEAEDDGGGPMALPGPADDLPDAFAERGRGLFLVRALVDLLESEISDDRTVVRVVRRAVVAGARP
ncbi:MAG TPA: SpoIIE family protein phosphatase [Acidimicrobiales bacterium]|nr:SpoIIE family protein phosphatase [Acidimicrobiales bacterium]